MSPQVVNERNSPFTFCIASHQVLLRTLLRDRLIRDLHAKNAWEVSSQHELTRSLPNLRVPDLLILDADLPGDDVLACARQSLAKRYVRRIVLLTDLPAAFIAQQSLRLGFHGIITKRDSLANIQNALRAILNGGLFVSPNVCIAEANVFSRVLTPREISVIVASAKGISASTTARELKLATPTVVTHRRNSMRKIGVRSQTELVLFAIWAGMVTLEQGLAGGIPRLLGKHREF